MASNKSRSVWSESATSTSGLSRELSANFMSDQEYPSTDEEDSLLIGEEDDPLIPPPSDIYRTFRDGKVTWLALLSKANKIPPGLWPAGMLDPYITLRDVPSLPEELPRGHVLYGRPCWHVPLCTRDAETTTADKNDDENDPTLLYGRRVAFNLGTRQPIRCFVSPEAASYFMGNSTETTNSLAVLTMCWSYILSLRFLEMQGREVEYSVRRLQPQLGEHHGPPTIYLEGASPALVRWLCAILSPNLGWRVRDKGLLPPWTACFMNYVQLVVTALEPTADTLLPPSSSEATELLLELCRLFKLGTDVDESAEGGSLPPYKAAFFAALMLPFYEFMDLRPQFPSPHLTITQDRTFSSTQEKNIREYVNDLQYFMTLSIHPPSLGSILWSIFWQPDIDCNLVSPWLASILDTLEPTIDGKRLETLVKVFISRRPKVALWWLAIFLLGDLSVLDWIRRYVEKMAEKYGFGTLSPPDPMVSAWTGLKQSFLDLEMEALYLTQTDLVSRADLLRCRFNFKLQDSASTTLSWRPFGYLQKQDVEPDLWPYLETKHHRQYHSFVWYCGRKPYPSSLGFRQDTGRDVKDVPDNLEHRSSGVKCQQECQHDIKLAPSKDSTLKMVFFMVEDVGGGRHWANAAIPADRTQHPWLHDWEGLDIMEVEEHNVASDVDAVKKPSWFLERWINREAQIG
ncbi:hypothetical protein AK830_g8147 [Neonectria ditissima]|uniref:Uncharacterized protein n=1 Tax=Neonectria ditissima TaxID=78410 RepID=A0A0P7B8P1_9HYPO|nr:hypothetical protein AK830_g8147 [Neonectria ditissima]